MCHTPTGTVFILITFSNINIININLVLNYPPKEKKMLKYNDS